MLKGLENKMQMQENDSNTSMDGGGRQCESAVDMEWSVASAAAKVAARDALHRSGWRALAWYPSAMDPLFQLASDVSFAAPRVRPFVNTSSACRQRWNGFPMRRSVEEAVACACPAQFSSSPAEVDRVVDVLSATLALPMDLSGALYFDARVDCVRVLRYDSPAAAYEAKHMYEQGLRDRGLLGRSPVYYMFGAFFNTLDDAIAFNDAVVAVQASHGEGLESERTFYLLAVHFRTFSMPATPVL